VRYWIVGAGGIGCALGARLAQHHEVLFVDGWREHVDAIRTRGLTVDYPDARVTVAVDAVHTADLGALDERPAAVLLAVKSYQTRDAVSGVLAHLDPDTPIVSLQNCINEQVIADIAGPERTIGAMVRFDGALRGPGIGSATRRERRLAIGELDGSMTDRIRALQEVLATSVATDVTPNIWGELWSKLARNSQVNALSVIGGLGLGQVVTNPVSRRLAMALGMETVRVALELGIELDPNELDGPPQAYLEPLGSPIANALEANLQKKFEGYPGVEPSMLQDVRKGRKTEIDQMNGHVVDQGVMHGVPTPLNAEVVRLVKEVERGERRLGGSDSEAVLKALAAQTSETRLPR
jgi:2-dehydropantoate 2-reductase